MWIFCTKMRKIHIFTILSSVLSFYSPLSLFLFPFFSFVISLLNLIISLLILSTDKNPFLFFSFLNRAQRFSSVAIRMVPNVSSCFSILISFFIHGMRNSSLSSASTITLSSMCSFSTNRTSIPSFVFSTLRRCSGISVSLMLKNVFFSSLKSHL